MIQAGMGNVMFQTVLNSNFHHSLTACLVMKADVSYSLRVVGDLPLPCLS